MRQSRCHCNIASTRIEGMQVCHPQLATVTTPQEDGQWSVTGDPARITIEGNDLKQQTAPHNHAVDVVET